MILAPSGDPELESRIAGLPPDGATVFTLGSGSLRGAILHGTRLVGRARANHGLGPLETLMLGRACLLAGLLSTTIKGSDRMALRVDGDGPAAGLSVDARADGAVRGYLFRNPIPLDDPPEGVELFPALFGRGALTMTRWIEGMNRPFSGTVALGGTGLARDLAKYYLESEQTRTAFDAGVEFDRSGRAVGAGALFLQALPGADDRTLARVEDAMAGLPPLGLWFAEGGTRDGFLSALLGAFDPERLGEKQLRFDCDCSREGFASFLLAGEREILADLAAKGPWPVEISCHNCGSVYRFGKDELAAMLGS
jgi:molecular chaperone Hsp33